MPSGSTAMGRDDLVPQSGGMSKCEPMCRCGEVMPDGHGDRTSTVLMERWHGVLMGHVGLVFSEVA